jgi:hypothetical protein
MALHDRQRSFRFLLHDRATKSNGAFDTAFQSEGIKIVRTPIRAPNANAHAQRWVRTLRSQCLDRILIRAAFSAGGEEGAATAATPPPPELPPLFRSAAVRAPFPDLAGRIVAASAIGRS